MCTAINKKARDSVSLAARWVSGADNKITWCQSFDDSVDREGVESRRSALTDLQSTLSDGESLRSEALGHIEIAIKAAVDEEEREKWLRKRDELRNQWTGMTQQCLETRYY